jgi:hypothetical protein
MLAPQISWLECLTAARTIDQHEHLLHRMSVTVNGINAGHRIADASSDISVLARLQRGSTVRQFHRPGSGMTGRQGFRA